MGAEKEEQLASLQVWVIMPESPQKRGTLWVKSLPCSILPPTGPSGSRPGQNASGAVALREIMERLGIVSWLAKRIFDPRA